MGWITLSLINLSTMTYNVSTGFHHGWPESEASLDFTLSGIYHKLRRQIQPEDGASHSFHYEILLPNTKGKGHQEDSSVGVPIKHPIPYPYIMKAPNPEGLYWELYNTREQI